MGLAWGQLQKPLCWASLPPPVVDETQGGGLESAWGWAPSSRTFLLQGWPNRCEMLVSRAPPLRQALGGQVRAGGWSGSPVPLTFHSIKSMFFPPTAGCSA